MNYKVIALIGKSGAGKDTIMQNILKKYPNYFNEIISCTSRPKREGEIEGKNYFFLSDRDFEIKVNLGMMLESTNFNNWYYGTSIDSLSKERVNIGVFNPAGIRALIKLPEVELITFEIVCSDKTRLLRQLNREESPNVNEIIRRYSTDDKDFKDLEFNTLKIKNETDKDLEAGAEYMYHVSEVIFS